MIKENYLFIDNIPILYPSENIAKQIKIELWLGMEAIEIDSKNTIKVISSINRKEITKKLEYIV